MDTTRLSPPHPARRYACGLGILDLAHQPDEYVAIEDLVASAKVMAQATLQLLGATA
jgi:succinyl-diaminopimelate desuccinylase